MNILITGGTRFVGIHCIEQLLRCGDQVTIATRGKTLDQFGNRIQRIVMDRNDESSISSALTGKYYDCVIDTLAYSSKEVKILLDHLPSSRYIMISSTAVYDLHENTKTADFDPMGEQPSWGWRKDFSYADGKRNAERAVFKKYKNIQSTAVRYPFVLGIDDYTSRLKYYVSHIMNSQPVQIDNYSEQMSFISSEEAGSLLAYFAHYPFHGAVNGASSGTISISEIAEYIRMKTGYSIIIQADAEPAPYNSTPAYSINIEETEKMGFTFSALSSWIYELLDWYISQEIKH